MFMIHVETKSHLCSSAIHTMSKPYEGYGALPHIIPLRSSNKVENFDPGEKAGIGLLTHL